jgi:DNA-binding LytR/AlgR family response regulator
MEIEDILKIYGKTDVAFEAITLVQEPLTLLAYRITRAVGSKKIVFWTAEGEKHFLPNDVKAVNLVSIQELVERINYLNERSGAIKKMIQSLG